MLTKWMANLGVCALAIALTGCGSTPIMINKSGNNLLESNGKMVTLVNLHADGNRGKLYAVNYQQSELIPLCSEVTVNDISGKRFIFTVDKTEKLYNYDYHKAAVDPFQEHLAYYFGESCDEKTLGSMSEIDKEGIKQGKPLKGMSKQGVILAMGYPPKHKTPTTDNNQWRYWKNRFATMLVSFNDEGLVTQIK